MKIKPFLMARISLLFIIVLGLIYLTSCRGGTISSPAGSSTSALQKESPLKITISTKKKEYLIGENIPVTVVYKNISNKPIRILGLTVWGHPLTFEIVDLKGEHSVTCRGTRYKLKLDKKDFVELQPGETLRRFIDINKYFLFTTPNIYTIRAYYGSYYGLPQTCSNSIFIILKAYKDIMFWIRYHRSDFKEICQHTLDLDWLQKFYHIDAPGRKPLIVLKNEFFNETPSLSKFGEPVVFLSEADIKEKKIEAYFVFSKILPSTTNDEAIIIFEYPVEGIVGKVHFRKDNSEWKIIWQQGGET